MSSLNRTAFREFTRGAAVRESGAPDLAIGANLAAASKVAGAFEEIRQACGAFEWVTFTYLIWVNTIVILFHRNIAHAVRHFAIHMAIGTGMACLVWAAARSRNSILQFARHWYPLPLYIFFFEELQGLVHAIFSGWFDRWLIAFDFNFAGVHPSVWLAQFASPALNDFMQFAYMTYFLYLVILPAILYAQRDRPAFWTVMVSTAIAHYTVYVIAILFPIESPFYSLASLQTKALAGGWCTATIGLIERFGRVHGAAFPSAHVAGSMVAILASWHYRRWLFWICLPFFASMCVATVYGRYHYVADVLAGIAVGAMGYVAGASLMERNGALGSESVAD
jgi:membrane-associated phospholipid phosphatase